MLSNSLATFALLLSSISTILAAGEGGGIMQALEPLIQVGAVGAILAFFLVKLEPRLRGIEVAIYTLVRSNMLMMMSSESDKVTDAMKSAAGQIVDEIKVRMPSELK